MDGAKKIGIEAIEFYLPRNYLSAEEISKNFEFDLDFVRNKIGVNGIFYADEYEKSSDMAAACLQKLLDRRPGLLSDLEVLVVCTQTPDTQLPQISSIVQNKCGLSKNLATFDLSLGCSGFVYGINVLKSFMASNGMKNGALITVETYSKIINPRDRNTKPLFSDAAAVTLLSEIGNIEICNYSFLTDGNGSEALACKENSSGLSEFFMDGRKVFNFVISNVPTEIYQTATINNLKINEIDYFVFHQASKFVLDSLAEKLELSDSNKVICEISKYGNTASSSIPITLKSISNLLEKPVNVLISGFGVGLSAASTILRTNGVKEL
jgi:3-oxoacyl-[acyl-carrier-protein] synthase-3